MSWFSSTFSRSAAPSPEQGRFDRREQEDDGESPSQGGKGVTDEFSELTKNLTRQLWGVASFLAPPPITQVESPKHTNTSQIASRSTTVAEKSEDPQVAVDVVAKEDKDFTESSLVAEVAGMETPHLAESQKNVEEISNSSASGSPSASGDKLTGFRSDLAELKGTMATSLSRIQTVIRAVTQDEDEDEEDDVGESSLTGDGLHRDSGLSSLLKPLLVSMSSFRERLPRSERREESPLVVGERAEGDMDYEIRPKPAGHSSLAGSIGGLSRLATSFIPYARDIVGEISGRDYFAVALTDEVVAFADNIAMHPETWLDFPLPEEEDNDEFEMTEIQQEHAKAVEELSSRLAAVHRELCPDFISDDRFWKIYFVLLHSRLNKEDAELLSTSQVLKTRELLLRIQNQKPRVTDTAPTQSEREELGLTESNMVHLPHENVAHEEILKSSAETAALPIMEEVSLDDASHPKSVSSQEILSVATDVEEEAHDSNSQHFPALKLDDEEADVDAWLDEDEENDVKETADKGAAVSIEEDVSFSDLEDDDDDGDECSKKEDGSHPVERDLNSDNDRTSDQASQGDLSCGSKPEGDWLTVNKEDVGSPTSSSS